MTKRSGGLWERIARITRRRAAPRPANCDCTRAFAAREAVRALTPVKNDGTYPHRDIGEVVVRQGDVGFVHESWSFLGQIYYTVEFFDRAVVVIMRGRELAKANRRAA